MYVETGKYLVQTTPNRPRKKHFGRVAILVPRVINRRELLLLSNLRYIRDVDGRPPASLYFHPILVLKTHLHLVVFLVLLNVGVSLVDARVR